MLLDEINEQLKLLEPQITTIKSFWENSSGESNFKTLTETTTREDFWQQPNQATILKKLQALKTQRDELLYISHTYTSLQELTKLFENDEQELSTIKLELTQLKKRVSSFKIQLLLSNKFDDSSIFFNINAGAGGTESQDWANMLLRMYLRFCEQEGLKTQILDCQNGEEAGIKSATLHITGKNAYGLLKSEHGIHRLVRISPFDSNKRRHTSFAGILVTPEIPEINEVILEDKDLRIDTYRASGAGGQHVNKTDSAVRITHLPSGIVVQCQNERSQIQNRATATSLLKAKLLQKRRDEQEEKMAAGIEKKKIEWGSQIRSYVLHPYKMVKDHRTHHESPQPELVLNGDLRDFLEAYLLSPYNKSE